MVIKIIWEFLKTSDKKWIAVVPTVLFQRFSLTKRCGRDARDPAKLGF
jgi:hypothetical protein